MMSIVLHNHRPAAQRSTSFAAQADSSCQASNPRHAVALTTMTGKSVASRSPGRGAGSGSLATASSEHTGALSEARAPDAHVPADASSKHQPPPGFGLDYEWPNASASWLSHLVFAWIAPLIQLGKSRPLLLSDLWRPVREDTCSHLQDRMLRLWADEQRRNALKGRAGAPVSFWRVLFRFLGRP